MQTIPPLQPNSSPVIINGISYKLIAFYYPDSQTPWDKFYQAPFLGNFHQCSFSVTINNIKANFHNSEAAFQCTKWWNDPKARLLFEGALKGSDAWTVKKGLQNPDMNYAGLGREGAMDIVLTNKFNDPVLKAGLLNTRDSYLLEHNETEGRDDYWSDNFNGLGKNMLGITLMKIRERLGGSGIPAGNYVVKDFTDQVRTS
jgi:predicted NAD-dependent protein-ADP-ribosyltransferase YbiA (DUF1768 family)